MLKQAFGGEVLGQKQTNDWFNQIKNRRMKLTMNIMDNLQLAQC
jgi:hypothetical protein